MLMIETSPLLPSRSWPRAVWLAGLAVYGPFVLMAWQMLVFVPCSHCKQASWTLLPLAPGIVPVALVRRWFGQSPPNDALGFILSGAVAGLSVMLLTIVARGRGWRRGLVLLGLLAVGSLSSFALMALIRA